MVNILIFINIKFVILEKKCFYNITRIILSYFYVIRVCECIIIKVKTFIVEILLKKNIIISFQGSAARLSTARLA